MIRLLWLAALMVIGWRLLTGRWPWQALLPAARHAAQEKQARALLGVAAGAGHRDIIEAHRRLVALVHPDRGGTNEQIHEANAARDLLLAGVPAPSAEQS